MKNTQTQKGKNIRRNLCRVLGTVVHSVINQSANLCLEAWIMANGSSPSCTYLRSYLSYWLTLPIDWIRKNFWPWHLSDISFIISLSPFSHSSMLYGFGSLQTCHNFLGKKCSDLWKWLKLSRTGITPGPCGQSEWECAIVQNILENALGNSSQVT